MVKASLYFLLIAGMSGFAFAQIPNPSPSPSPPPGPVPGDFNGDGHPDLVLYNASTHQTAIWYLNNNVVVGWAMGPTLPRGWVLRAVDDFNHDGHPDYVLLAPTTRQTAIYYLNNNVFIGYHHGPTLPICWELVATADINGDGYPDYVLYSASTRQTETFFLNNNFYVGSSSGPTILAGGWSVVGMTPLNYICTPPTCFALPGPLGYVLFNSLTGQTVVEDPSGEIGWGPTVRSGWALVAVADFNGDGTPDYLLYNASTRQTAIWYLNFGYPNPYVIAYAYGPTLPPGWSLIPQ